MNQSFYDRDALSVHHCLLSGCSVACINLLFLISCQLFIELYPVHFLLVLFLSLLHASIFSHYSVIKLFVELYYFTSCSIIHAHYNGSTNDKYLSQKKNETYGLQFPVMKNKINETYGLQFPERINSNCETSSFHSSVFRS